MFGIGLSKTGTSSLSRALELLGYNSLHWKKRKKVIGWPEFFWADAATDISVSARFEALYHTFDNSKFIYTTRDVDSWSTSIARHYGMESPRGLRYTGDRRLSTEGRRLIQQDPEWGFHNTIHEVQAHESLYAQHDTWKEAYRAHDNRIRTFFDDKPDDQFLEMSITGGDKWEPLCAFLGHEVVDRSFPHVDPSE